MDAAGLILDVGASWTKASVVRGGELGPPMKLRTPEEPGSLVELVGFLARGLGFVGVSFAGFMREGRVAFCPNMKAYQGFPLVDELSKALGVPVRVENDGNAFALGEALFGAGRGARVVLGVTLGTGVGGGLVVDGELYRGLGGALELGHMVVEPEGPACGCGGRGHLEALVGEAHLKISGREAFEKANRGEKEAIRFWKRYGEVLGLGLASAINLLDPEVVVLGGGLAGGARFFWDPMLEVLRREVVAWEARGIRVVLGSLGERAALFGVLSLMKKQPRRPGPAGPPSVSSP